MIFEYRAIKDGKIIKNKIESISEKEVVDYLKANNLIPIQIKTLASNNNLNFDFFNRVSFSDLVNFTRQLAIMLNAGLTLVDCFEILKKQIVKQSLKKVIEEIDNELRAGKSFSSSLSKYPQIFPKLYIALVRSGEASGKLSEILLKLSDNLEKQREFQGKTKGALIYPLVILIAMGIVMFVMITFVIPKLLDLYKDFNVELPMTTQLLITTSDFFRNFWPLILIIIIGVVVVVRQYIKTSVGKLMLDQYALKLPIFGNIIKTSSLVDSTRTLSILINSGVSILDGLNIVIDTTNNMVYQNAFRSILRQVEKGISLGVAMQNEEVFPVILIQMVLVGEQTGHLDETLGRISKYFEMESELAMKTLTTLIEPFILVVLGLGVGFLVISVITPIYSLTSSFK
jgi:type IV pilus assembly protein PilC